MPTVLFKKPPSDDPNEELVKEVMRRLDRADLDYNRHKPRLDDCYKYALPWRHSSEQTESQVELDEVFDEEAMIVVEDFSADMLNTFTPPKATWVDIQPVETLSAGELKQLEEPLARYREVLFSEMSRSNLYQALQEAYLDLGPGTMGLMIDDLNIAEPIHCEAIPIPDLRLDRGPYNSVDKFRRRKLRAEQIPVLWPDALAPKDKEWKEGDETTHMVVDGLWRDWSVKTAETYKYIVMADSEIILEKTFQGQGSNPMIVARWSRDSLTAWGVGPTYRTTPAIKVLNHWTFLTFKNYDKHIDPAMSYEDDGVINTDHGVGPGDWIPRAVGSDAPEALESKGSFQYEAFNIEQRRTAIRRAHYQDMPDQVGKTPPSATQWADEAAIKARRMGTPATNLVIELQYPIIYRFAYLLKKRGVLPDLELNGELVAVQPTSPLLKAQEQEEVIRMDRFAEMIQMRFGPEVANVIIHQIKYASRLAKLIGVDPEVVRTEEEIADAIEQFAPVITGTPLGGEETARGP